MTPHKSLIYRSFTEDSKWQYHTWYHSRDAVTNPSNRASVSKNGSGWTVALPPVVKVKVSPKKQFVLLLGIGGRIGAAD